ncbi:hypothetical protein NMN56_027565 [Streptomyces iconiensis]|uniref:Uncharacterized protein n=1 Tax=Streptomyces iconiensis TaxID=1384038 RepID=A0ABT7A2U9_9ACTN|nr:hypothetical protein [Streptomyces iconiensis]
MSADGAAPQGAAPSKGPRPLFVALGAVALLLVLLAAWAYFGLFGGPPPDVDESDLTGGWKGNRGGQMHFREDGRFSAEGIALSAACAPADAPPGENARVAGTGTWKLGEIHDEGPGALITFRPEGGSGGGAGSCEMKAVFVGPDSPTSLYLTHDDGGGQVYERK